MKSSSHFDSEKQNTLNQWLSGPGTELAVSHTGSVYCIKKTGNKVFFEVSLDLMCEDETVSSEFLLRISASDKDAPFSLSINNLMVYCLSGSADISLLPDQGICILLEELIRQHQYWSKFIREQSNKAGSSIRVPVQSLSNINITHQIYNQR